MNIATPTIDETIAALHAVERYREILKRGKSYNREEDELMLAMHKQIAAGRPVINAFDAITEGGADELQRPRLFLARANWTRIEWVRNWHGSGYFFNAHAPHGSRYRKNHCIHLPDRVLPHEHGEAGTRHWSVVPSIPPHLRPRGRIDGYYILSEARWQSVPGDPALLQPIRWPLCAVVAVWDLTDLERQVLRITRGGSQ
jgi:hypothetical protein